MKKNIKSVVKNALCAGCGTCVSLCPERAIKIDIDEKQGIYVPRIDEDKCNNCGICLKSCPRDFDKDKKSKNILIGNYLNCYSGHAKDYNLRYNSSSGGVITSLLIFALEKGIIDGALVVKMKKDKPLEPEPFIARTKGEIINASGSKYCPVPVNIALKEILKSNPREKFAVVGLPCHILGMRKAERVNKELKEKIVLHFGLFCSHVPSFHGTKNLLKKFNIKQEEVIKLDYRGKGWPGHMKILKKNEEVLLSLLTYWKFIGSALFTSTGCLACSDSTSELSDLSFGDAWLPEFKNNKVGESIVISRTQRGEEILKKAKKEKAIQFNSISSKKVISSQITTLYLKKKNLRAGVNLSRKKVFLGNTLRPDLLDYLLAFSFWFNRSFFRKLVKYIPLKIFFLYNKFFNVIYHKKACYDFKKYIKRD